MKKLSYLKLFLFMMFSFLWAFGCAGVNWPSLVTAASQARQSSSWLHLSSKDGDVDAPSAGTQQTASLILDVDGDGLNDIVIGVRQQPGPSLVWYRRGEAGWTKYLIDDTPLDIEAGGAYADIDGDGDLDIVMGGDYQSSRVWWWENPYPDYAEDTPWTRREIKNSGANKHHDQMFGDFDGDGENELVFWNQGASALMLADIPADPKTTQPWSYTPIYTWESEEEEHEGLAKADIDGDGQIDIIGGGHWFKYEGGTNYAANLIDQSQYFTRAAAGQLIPGGRPELVFVTGDGEGLPKWYEWDGDSWTGHSLLNNNTDHAHSLEIADLNGDGHLDIFNAEMRLDGGNSDAKMWIFYGDGQGSFTTTEIATGFGTHEARVADLDGDGDLDILGKPYNWETPRLDIWLNNPSTFQNQFQRHVIDAERPWTAIFITAQDLDGDAQKDIITGGWWYKNPGSPDGDWERFAVGAPFNNMAAVADFDGDGDFDLLGTMGQGSNPDSRFVWARNNGEGQFTILDNIPPGEGDFLQGVAVDRFHDGELAVALSWHEAGKGIQLLTVPEDPSAETWQWERISTVSQDEGLSAGDIDRDGDADLLLGTIWLQNNDGAWTSHTLSDAEGLPDRNRLADINRDGRLDAVVGYEAISQPGKLAWYEQGDSPTAMWTEHPIADPPVVGPMSLDAADFDQDGDLDIVVGEHNPDQPSRASLYVYENADERGGAWTQHVLSTGDEHHDGAQAVDIDQDGDLDILSIGWSHSQVLLYENQASLIPGNGSPVYLPIVTADAEDSASANTPPQALETKDSAASACRTADPRVLYTFEEGQGTVIRDRSGAEPALDLNLPASGTRWIPGGGLVVEAPALIRSQIPAEELIRSVQESGEISIAAWIQPANLEQDGPARIVTLSQDVNHANFTLGQGLWGDQAPVLYDVRLRTRGTSQNGQPSLSVEEWASPLAKTHLVYTHEAGGASKIYLNGKVIAQAEVPGSLSAWDPAYRLALANEMSGDRPWLGAFYHLAVYDCALTGEEVRRAYREGMD